MTKEQFEFITMWQKQTFGNATPQSKIAHLAEELQEVIHELRHTDPDTDKLFEEFADCFSLLFGAASSAGMTYDDITRAINHKMLINVNRKWGEPDENGVVKHIKNVEPNEQP